MNINQIATAPEFESSDYCINLTVERVYRLDLPSALSHPFEHDRALHRQVEVRVPGEPEHFKEWLDLELAGMAKGEEFFDYLDLFLEE